MRDVWEESQSQKCRRKDILSTRHEFIYIPNIIVIAYVHREQCDACRYDDNRIDWKPFDIDQLKEREKR